ncbi:MAG: YecA family protein [Deltaproteobacteria bacterium]
MDKTGRKDPCPCGSGKKYKRCCGASAVGTNDEAQNPALALHRADGRVVDDVLRWAKKRFGAKWGGEAFEVYLGDGEFDALEAQLLGPWSVYCFEVEGKPPAAHYLDERGSRLPNETRAWLEAQLAAWLSIWEVLEVQPGKGLRVRDLLTREERFVHEVSGSMTLGIRDAVLARVTDYGGVSTFCGTHPRFLPPGNADFVVRQGRRFCHVRTKAVSRERLRSMDVQYRLIHEWRLAVEERDRPQPFPTLTNTDGDPFLLTKDHFDFDPVSRSQVIAQLQKLEGAQEPDEGELEGEVSITFTKAGNARFKAWENTSIGRADVGADRLTLETNSVPRADALRERVEVGLGGLLRHRLREHSDMDALLKARREMPDRGEDAEAEALRSSPEVKAFMREFKAKHMASWVDEEIPALGGLTPREAVAKPASRARVDLLLREMENHERALPAEERYDFGIVRRELGLA